MGISVSAALSLLALSASSYASSNPFFNMGGQGVNFWKLDKMEKDARQGAVRVQGAAGAEFEPQFFRQPLDHFNNETGDTFLQRFWVSTRHFKPGTGAPVIVLDGGETSGEDRLPYLDTGIVDLLAKNTGGVGVILEHRYYGESIATMNLTTDALRFLNNEQAAADSANFMANVKFDGIDEDLTAPNTPWIYYGGSYAGARSAHMRVLYPDLVYGAIASSGVTEAILENWEYMEIIRTGADRQCMSHIENSVVMIDEILAEGHFSQQLKALFGMQNVTHDVDFVSVISNVLGAWQSKNWDPAVNSLSFDRFCTAINAPLNSSFTDANNLPFNHPKRMVRITDGFAVDFAIINYGNYTKEHVASRCPASRTQDDCFGTFDDSAFQHTGLDQDWRLWQFQVCTQWGFYTTPPPDPKHPRIISRLLTLDYLSKLCKQAYLPGERFVVPTQPNITQVNDLGGYAIAADRLAIIDGQVDPWRPCTPHADEAKPRRDTTLRPFKLISGAVHHWDENGLANTTAEPPVIQEIHAQEVEFVKAWLKDFKAKRN
ncbi:hypothetical protein AMATHDRAFT_62072 [Amanita thiersii Skay4041]|uniref:Peptidase S28 n=1 Tax=Amanita thiersii Skay4041 TaxID=703135 RepID=A0A2A9NQI9_9AGAR|nr:hypothetical protein AMATHDRAFT_62072 [Amanita thiersii Skay4041]